MPLSRLVQRTWPPALLTTYLFGCSAPEEAKPLGQPEGWNDQIRLREPVDLNPDPNVLEINLEARVQDLEILPGTRTPAWTYDGALPGPLLRAKVGDRLVVHFRNSLPEPTTIHWHGLRIPAAMDGVPDHTRGAIPPGGSFDYDFVLPDAGTYWYHPHFASAAQVGDGLYGPIVVEDPSEPSGLGDESVLVLSDMSVRSDGTLEPPDGGGDFGTLFGREGNLHLVNGKLNPTLTLRAGMRQRWRIINAAKSRYEQLSLAETSFVRIGGEGGLMAEPQATDTLLLTPGQRVDVVFEPRSSAAVAGLLPLRWKAYDRGFGTAFNRPDEDIMQLAFADGPSARAEPLPSLSRDVPPLVAEGATPVDITLTLDTKASGGLAMGINGVPSWQAEELMASVGERQLWSVQNTFDWDHPFHLHGFFFQVLDESGVPPSVAEWRDTVNVPVGGTLRFLVQYDERPGTWMFHCHILDHADAGMMGMLHLH
jgi:FtsP/CotA-like multicopper oxidase with cupredoxin domain